ncbi:MAG: aminodeoxychorismate synthase component I [Bdellovibrionales bacterium]
MSIHMKPFVVELKEQNPLAVFAAVEHLPYSILFDSADLKHKDARYSFIVSHPIETIETKNGTSTLTNWDEQTTQECDPFDILTKRMKHWRDKVESARGLPPFQGGAAGLFSYDLGRSIEDVPAIAKDNKAMPDMAVGIYDTVIAFDHDKKQSWIITHANDYQTAKRKQDYILSIVEGIEEPQPETDITIDWHANFSRHDYEQRIRKTIDYIKAGDIFQANIAQRFDAKLPEDFNPFEHYLRLRQINAAPFACYMNTGNTKISSASPERFLSSRQGRVFTQPIKGTRPVSQDQEIDEAARKDLLHSEKDKAENTMIVDLLRNDLSKVCKTDSVEVSDLCALETFASVHHLVSTIRAELKEDKTPVDLLKACFPGGSITGAPKIRAMEIIEELEPSRRGPYCGSIGYIGFDGTMDTNILIRTLVYEGNTVSLQSGGGIVVDSDPSDEYQETLDKARAMFKSFENNEEDDAIPLAG